MELIWMDAFYKHGYDWLNGSNWSLIEFERIGMYIFAQIFGKPTKIAL